MWKCHGDQVFPPMRTVLKIFPCKHYHNFFRHCWNLKRDKTLTPKKQVCGRRQHLYIEKFSARKLPYTLLMKILMCSVQTARQPDNIKIYSYCPIRDSGMQIFIIIGWYNWVMACVLRHHLLKVKSLNLQVISVTAPF